MTRPVSALLVALSIVAGSASATLAKEHAATKDAPWVSLFDGKTLKGWEQRGGKAKYSVKDGVIVGETVPRTPNSFLCTRKVYGDFILEYEFKCDNALNSGVQIRSNAFNEDTVLQFGPMRKKIDAGRVHGYQVEIDPNKPERKWTGGIYDEARRGWLNPLEGNEAARAAAKPGEWNKVRVRAVGDHIQTWINGVPCADLRDAMTLTGFIGLQVHGIGGKQGGPWRVMWRNLRIKDLGRHVWKPLFDGKTLDGFTAMPGGKWEVKDGVIVGTSPKSEKRHGQLVTDKRFGDFTVRVKFRSIKGNSGFYFRVDRVKSAVAVNGFQAEVEPGAATGGLYETGGRGWVAKSSPELMKKIYKGGEWSRLTVSAHGKRIVVHVNDHKTVGLKNDPGRTEGHIALQLHGSDEMLVEFKNLEMLVPAGR